MTRLAERAFAAFIALVVASSMVAGPAAADHVDAPTDDEQLNYNADTAPDIYAHADNVSIAEHDRAAMSDPLAIYDDNGDMANLADDGASYNDSQTAPFGVNLSHVKDLRYRTFPRLSSESGNGASWTNAGNWSTSSSTDGSMSVSAGTVDGANVSTVTFSATDSSSASTDDHAQATYSRVSITEDATKRVPQVGANVKLADSATRAEIRFVDAGGDYVSYIVNTSSAAAANESVLTNMTDAEAVVAQEKANDLTVRGNGDGTLDGIQEVTVRVEGTNAAGTVELFWLDAAAKSTEDLAEVERDTDGDGDLETTYIEDKWQSGYLWTTGLDTLPSWASDATVFDLKVSDVSFNLRGIPDGHTNISIGDHPTYDGGELDAYWTSEVPAYIDVSYENLQLLAEQTAQSDRYETVEYATDTGDTNLTNVSYTDATSSFTDQGETVTLVANLQTGEHYSVHVEQALTEGERDELTNLAAMGGPIGGGGGFFSSIWGQVTGVIGAALGALGLRRLLGGGGN